MDAFETFDLPTPGPLMSAALALFGNGTLLQAAKEATTQSQQKAAVISICQHSRVPFYLYGPVKTPPLPCYNIVPVEPSLDLQLQLLLPGMVAGFMQIFNSPVSAQQLLEITAFFSNEALLLATADLGTGYTRDIHKASGYTIIKPQLSYPGIAVISAMIGLQVTGILALLWFIYSAPSWTVSLDAPTLARIGAQLHTQGKELDGFNVSGVVGIGEYEDAIQQQPGTTNGTGPARRKVRMLGLGETGVVSKASLQGKFG